MKWVNTRGGNPVLIVHKAGTLHLLSGESPLAGWSGCKTLTLRAQTRSVGSSALCPVSGICYDPNLDASVLSLSDGSFHVVHGISVEPTLDSSPESVSSDALSAVSRTIFLQTEQDKMSFQDVDQVNGMTTYDDHSTFMWIYEPSRPTDFSYKHDAKHISTLVVAQMWQENRDERIIEELAERIGRSPSGFGGAPIGRLRSLFLHLRNPQIIARLHKRILDTLSHTPCSEPTPDFVIPSYIGDWDANLSHDLVDSLAKHLFGWKSVQSVRIRYAVAAYCQSCSAAADVEPQFAEAAHQSVRDIRAHFLLVVLRHLSALRDVLNASDVYFARRTVLLATMPGTPSALAKEAGELLSQLLPTADTDPSRLGVEDSINELCPACHASIPLQDADNAVCPNGHVWARCCVTSLLLATPSVRTCVGCARKAFLHASAHDEAGSSVLPNSARGSRLLRDLLDASRRCPFCGNNFVALV
ncbi:hypothetical protein TRAPUB_12265 [Trametes pubescens]|uniref:Transcription factor IIIC putative zinc-finger domain-containing protein n=1 Tax=Trametes pubescens TaxID=154538 RepID=A0A1M2VUD1_TRAPU|nr:hypothetical protein TRAPUB_12265 [Trametes pubescens]